MTYLGVSVLVFLAPFLLGAGLVVGVIAAGVLLGFLRQERALGPAPGRVPARRAMPQAAFDRGPGFQIVDFSFRQR